MVISRRALLALTLLVVFPLFFVVAKGGGDAANAVPTPVLASPNVELVTTVPGSAAISGEFSPSAPFFYTSGLDSISVFDISNPKNPVLKGKLANLVFENEAMSYGERAGPDGKVVRFVLVGVDLYQAGDERSNPPRGNVLGGEVVVVDVSDPSAPRIRSRTPQNSPLRGTVTTSTHTVQCVTLRCDYAYTAGDGNLFSVVDLRDLDAPRQVATPRSAASGSGPISEAGAGHYWDIDDSGLAWHTGGGGTAVFDASDPAHPKALNATNARGTETPYNDFIHHNSMRPNARSFKAGAAPSLADGNVALVTEEDYASEGDEIVCDRSGTFQTWKVPDLDGEAYRAGNPELLSDKGNIEPLDIFQAPAEAGGGLSTPVGGFCSAHWFDYHQSGIVAQGWYQQGMRLIDVRDPGNIKQHGYFTAGATQVWDAYWVPARNADGTVKAGREKTNIIYTADLLRGLDVFVVSDMPPAVQVSEPTTNRTDPFDPNASNATRPTAGAQGAGRRAPRRQTKGGCGAPASRLGRSSRLRSGGARLRGTATPGAGCTLRSVSVAIGRRTGSRCRFLRADGTFGATVSCARTRYLRATGTARWRLDKKVRLPRGAYVVWSRAVNSAGQIEKQVRTRNLLRTKVTR